MSSALKAIALLALTAGFATVANAGASGSGTTTRYWDCCKGSCAWDGKADVSAPVTTCDIDNNVLTDTNAGNGCTGGDAYMCADQSPWAANDTLAFGFAAVNIAGGSESSWCCACYKLTFTSTALAGKTMIVQATNTGGDLGSNQFDLAMPGGGVGIYNGCTAEWGAPSSGWGAQYGGISSDTCSTFPTALQAGCGFRWDWFQGADNPTVDFEQITCPSELTAKTGCTRSGETPVAYVSGSDSSSAASSAASSVASSAAASSSVAASSVVQNLAAIVSTPAAVSSAASSVGYTSAATSAQVESSAASSPVLEASSSVVAAASAAESSSAAYTPSSSAVESSYAAYTPSSSAAVPTSSAAAAAATGPTGESDPSCQVQYVYEYDL